MKIRSLYELRGTKPDWRAIGKRDLGFAVGLNSLGKQAKDAVEGAAVLVHGALVKLPVELVLGIANLVKDPQGTVESVGDNVESIVAGIQALPEYIEHAPAEVKAYLDSINSLEDPYEQGEALGKLVGDVLPTAVATGSILDRTFQRVSGAAKGFNKVGRGVGRRLAKDAEKALGTNVGFVNHEKAVAHFSKHGDSIKRVLGEKSYKISNYLSDANHIINHGIFVPELNAYVRFIGSTGGKSTKFGFVGVDKTTGSIATFHIKTVEELAREAPSLGLKP